MRYLGQIHECTVNIENFEIDNKTIEKVKEAFHKRHEELFTYSELHSPVELVNIESTLYGRIDRPIPTEIENDTLLKDALKNKSFALKLGYDKTKGWMLTVFQCMRSEKNRLRALKHNRAQKSRDQESLAQGMSQRNVGTMSNVKELRGAEVEPEMDISESERLQLTGEKLSGNWAEYQAIGDKVDKLKKLAEELECPIITAVQANRSGERGSGGRAVDDSSAIAQSDRLQWFASFVGIFRRKFVEELASDGEEFGTHKLIMLKTRFQGRDAAGHHDLVRRTDENGSVRFEANFLNFNVGNFNIEEVGSAADIAAREAMQYSLEDESNRDGDVI